jgi:hypothetical protein
MKKQLIKEAFRLQQIAGIRPINEILPSSNTPRRKGLQEELMGQETLNLKAESTGGGTYYISIVSSYGTDNYLQEETFNSYEECLISVIGDGGGDTDDLNPEEHDVEFLEKTLDELIEEHDGEWTVASIIGKNEGKLYVGP